ncbi:MAG: hypothetical protein K8R99_05915 [Actinomycetia bacterium]|nr:hypothetical protein [Actinomycetes bacterium]
MSEASLRGVEVKLARAREHARTLHEESRAFFEQDLYRFVVDVHNDGRKHVWRTDCDPPSLPDHFAALLGDFVHNLRSALDHLAWQLVLLNGGEPHELTQFPIRSAEFRYIDRVAQPAVVVRGGVSDIALSKIRAVQPYATEGGTRDSGLWWLHKLNVIDKHRHLLVFAAGAFGLFGGWTFPTSIITPLKPLKRDEVVMVLTYASRQEVHKDMKPMLAVFLAKTGVVVPTDRRHMSSLMDGIYMAVETVIDRFRPMFGIPTISTDDAMDYHRRLWFPDWVSPNWLGP